MVYLLGRTQILAFLIYSALLCCITGNDMEWLYLLCQMPCDLATSGEITADLEGNTNLQGKY